MKLALLLSLIVCFFSAQQAVASSVQHFPQTAAPSKLEGAAIGQTLAKVGLPSCCSQCGCNNCDATTCPCAECTVRRQLAEFVHDKLVMEKAKELVANMAQEEARLRTIQTAKFEQ
jgi:hypothetical protein